MSVPVLISGEEHTFVNTPIRVHFTNSQLKLARQRAERLGTLNRSFTQGRSNLYGMLGEIIVANFTGSTVADTYDYDLIDPEGRKLDVKTKKTTSTATPPGHYTATVWGGNTRQRCDAYVFVRICANLDLKLAFICGWMSKPDFYAQAVEYKKGQVDSSNGYQVHADCWNIRVDKLSPLHQFIPWEDEEV